jgi:hypothetical protein
MAVRGEMVPQGVLHSSRSEMFIVLELVTVFCTPKGVPVYASSTIYKAFTPHGVKTNY